MKRSKRPKQQTVSYKEKAKKLSNVGIKIKNNGSRSSKILLTRYYKELYGGRFVKYNKYGEKYTVQYAGKLHYNKVYKGKYKEQVKRVFYPRARYPLLNDIAMIPKKYRVIRGTKTKLIVQANKHVRQTILIPDTKLLKTDYDKAYERAVHSMPKGTLFKIRIGNKVLAPQRDAINTLRIIAQYLVESDIEPEALTVEIDDYLDQLDEIEYEREKSNSYH